MKTKFNCLISQWSGIGMAMLVAAGALPSANAQTAEDFEQLKALVLEMQKTIAAQDQRIKELEQSGGAAASASVKQSVLDSSASVQTLEKVAAGEMVGSLSPVTYRPSMNDQQDAASRPMDYTLDPSFRGFIPVPNTPVLIKFNAKPHVDFIFDDKNTGNENRFVPALFPLESDPAYSEDGQFHATANATQIKVDVRAPEFDPTFRFFYQNDFFGSGSDFGDMKYRVQHLYGQLGGFKAGFTFGVWEDPDSWPDTVDYEGPNSVIFSRRPVAQYTKSWNENWNTTFGVEKPDIYVDVDSGPAAGGMQRTRMPDLGLNTRFESSDFGHLQFSATVRELGAEDANGVEHYDTGWGLNASAVVNFGDATTFQFLGVIGDGVGGMGNDTSFLNSDAAFNSSGELEALPYWSMHFGLTHRWNETFRSTVTYGYVNLDNTDGQAPTFYHTSTYASGNLIWQMRDRLSLGFELLYGNKEARNGEESGDHFRLQTGMVYSIFD